VSDAPREKTFLLARPEGRVLEWVARRLPARVTPDHMTALGVLAALGIGAAYWLTLRDPAWLWVASGLLVIHWLGDSLDGTLARVRRIERPRYGYYLDHLLDAGATIVIGAGLGLSPYMSLVTGLAIVVVYLALSINTYLETQVFGVFSLGYGRFGPTEARVGLIALNLALLAGASFEVAGQGLIDLVGLGAAALMLVALGVRAARNLRVLAAREPAGVVRG
jgi:archaetidylinositol phosphate synthase